MKKHGHSSTSKQTSTRTYRAWCSAKKRCLNPRDKSFHRYGGRGIGFCDRWNSFTAFLEDMGVCPDGLELDRIDNDKGYGPDNCRWATNKQQSNNRANTKMVEWRGESSPISVVAELSGVPIEYLRRNIGAGYSSHEVISKYHSGLFGKKERFRGECSRASRLTLETVKQIADEYHAQENSGSRKPRGFRKALADKYGINPGYVSAIVAGKTNWL